MLTFPVGLFGGYTPTGVQITPTMTSDTAPVPYVASSSSNFDAVDLPWRAFDNTTQFWATAQPFVSPQWLALDFGSPVWVASYSIQARNANASTQAPKDFTLQGSHDGTSWTTADTETGHTWTNGQVKTFTLAAPMQFRRWRLNITAINGGTLCAVDELNFFA